MSFFGEDDFSFLHNNYRDRNDDDDESDASSSDGEEDDEQSCTYVGVTPQSPVSVPDSPCDNQGGEGQEDSDGEPSPWRDSKAKHRIPYYRLIWLGVFIELFLLFISKNGDFK